MSEHKYEVIKTIHDLRSTRKFQDKAISKGDLNIILGACVRAANSSGRQNYSIIVVEEKETLRQLFYEAKVGLIFCVDYTRIIDTAKFLKHKYEVGDIRSFVSGCIDTSLVAQTAAIAAQSLGIDSLFTNSIHRTSFEILQEHFNLPKKYCFPLVALCLGYSAEERLEKKGRLANEGIIHLEKHKRLTDEQLDKLVKAYDDPERKLGMLTKEELTEQGFERYLDWFFEKWSRRFDAVPFEDMQSHLKKIGFIK